ncbi:3-oxoacyl-[acyl-carrier-protein] synthase III C-terminal domain-containing protein [Providencia vermicola]|uniref:Ketoacyl-ACP synthase III n=2 Tax=Providencia TaxID=586 RepID=A0AAI9HX64_PROST|nr:MULTISPECIES: 3-oxoacyl-[acyl-carrier-protein] synthase III C-terminal domain-containing protein [Providencia]ELR5045398.1 ketoacyl-ACP synthase III [Providencia rettgeri]ELR5034200.1 ketoacyl-ACP synthase III [Providencia stuartii]ELR5121363.1 ketoacyl-ACP synthase III [Providencia stuartii]ELR5142089.1 ketoacyl-ACP synthase III [Providencia stuartii]ELR5291571.1 ketoacyl-ACP synthase III [Providencia stuartii]
MLTNPLVTPIKIIASGIALPKNKIDSQELDVRLNKPSGYVKKYSGIDYRFHANNEDSQAQLAADSLHHALEAKQIPAQSIDMLISASAISVQALPCTAAHILAQSRLKQGIACFDINASCVSFITALQVAAGFLSTSQYQRIAIVSADLASRGIDWHDNESALIFGDGAACVIVEKGDGTSGIITYHHETHTEGIELCEIRAGGTRRNPRAGMTDTDFLFHMQGKKLFRMASSLVERFMQRVLTDAHLPINHIGTVIPHQASHLSLEHMRQRLGVKPEQLIDIYRFRGNQVAASIPSALHEAIESGRFYEQKNVMLIGTAAGLAFCAMVLIP